VVASLQALEALKLLAGLEPTVTDAFLQLDLLRADVTRVAVGRRSDCPDCGL
jgi:molybdopterin/thiamine biosynthesis adenylyltransferase